MQTACKQDVACAGAGHGGNHVHAFLVHEIGQDDVAEGQ